MTNNKAFFRKLLKFLILVLLSNCIIFFNTTSANINVTNTNTTLVISEQKKGFSNFCNGSTSLSSDPTSTPNFNITAPVEVYDQSVLTIIIDYKGSTPGADYLISFTKPMANMTENIYEVLIICNGYSSHTILKLYVSGVKWINGTVSIEYPYVYEEHFSVKVLPKIETHRIVLSVHFVLLGVFTIVIGGKVSRLLIFNGVKTNSKFQRGDRK